jgi:peptide chain release factor subunit 1
MATLLTETIDRLSEFEPAPFPVLSLYLNAQPDAVGRDRFEAFLRKQFTERLNTYRASSPERESFERDVARIERYLAESLRSSANGVAIFACAGADEFFEAVQLDAPVEEHRLYVSDRPHLYPLARLDDQYPRYAAVLADTTVARIFVFGTNRLERQEEVAGQKTRRVKAGGWSQARFQRHVENYHLHHVKEVVDTLDRIVRDEAIPHVLLAGDEVVIPLFREQLPAALAAKVLDVLRLDTQAPEREVLEATLAALRQSDAESDAELASRLLDEVRREGLGVVGAEATLTALRNGQVDVLLILAHSDLLTNAEHLVPGEPVRAEHTGNAAEGLAAVDAAAADATTAPSESPATEPAPPAELVANHLVTLARQTSATVRFIEDPLLLAEAGGVGALLRFRI